MTEAQKIIRDMVTLRESIELANEDWFKATSPTDKAFAIKQVKLLTGHLQELLERLERLP